MSNEFQANPCRYAEMVAAYAVMALPAIEAPGVRSHIQTCEACRRDLNLLRPVVKAFGAWPADVLHPSDALSERLAARIAAQTGTPLAPPPSDWSEPAWLEVTPGIFCKLLATDADQHRVSMLVRLLPGVEYPPHTHADVEELHLLAGELWIDERKLYPGDYNRANAHTTHQRVWSETGCTCLLVTSTHDVLR